jgi:tetratricopeptide (TPR) repeat protein
MRRRRLAPRARKTTRRWHIPPPLVHGPEPLEGGSILEELQTRQGALLWQSLRDVMLWADTPAEERDGLFAPDAAERREAALAGVSAGEVAPALRTLATLVADPAGVSPERISVACADIARWAEAQDALRTAMAFAQDAALAEPSDPDAAFTVARLAVRIADHARAEVWFRRAIGLARQAHDWRRYARAFSGLGNLYMTRGNLPAAHRFHVRALRGARRGGVRAEQAAALHDLFGVAIETGRIADAERYAAEAAAAYGSRNPRLAVLAHDVAYFWMQQGHFARSLAVFEAVLPLIEQPVERLFVEADLMRAAAGAGDTALAARVAREVWEKASRSEFASGAPRALLELGKGALQLNDLELAGAAARRALELAGERREGKTRLEAEALDQAIEAARAATRPPTPASSAPRGGEPTHALAEELIRTLRELASRTAEH